MVGGCLHQTHHSGRVAIDHQQVRFPGGNLQWADDESRALPLE